MAIASITITGDTPVNTITRNGDVIDFCTYEASEPNHNGAGGTRSLWYQIGSATGNNITVDALASTGFNPQVAVYTGSSVDALTLIVQGAGSVTFNSGADTLFAIAISDDFGGIF